LQLSRLITTTPLNLRSFFGAGVAVVVISLLGVPGGRPRKGRGLVTTTPDTRGAWTGINRVELFL
jgi:hypothetical protein